MSVSLLRKCRQTAGVGPREKPFYLMNTTQAASRSPCVTLVPALIRNSVIYSMQHGRVLTAPELFQVQGFPIFEAGECPYQCCSSCKMGSVVVCLSPTFATLAKSSRFVAKQTSWRIPRSVSQLIGQRPTRGSLARHPAKCASNGGEWHEFVVRGLRHFVCPRRDSGN